RHRTFFYNRPATTVLYTLSLHDALPIYSLAVGMKPYLGDLLGAPVAWDAKSGRTTPQGLSALRAALRTVVAPKAVVISLGTNDRSEEHTSELQSQSNLVCRLLLEKKKQT